MIPHLDTGYSPCSPGNVEANNGNKWHLLLRVGTVMTGRMGPPCILLITTGLSCDDPVVQYTVASRGGLYFSERIPSLNPAGCHDCHRGIGFPPPRFRSYEFDRLRIAQFALQSWPTSMMDSLQNARWDSARETGMSITNRPFGGEFVAVGPVIFLALGDIW